MLLTITTTYQPATDLGYLLHKHPSRAQSFSLSFGKAHVSIPKPPRALHGGAAAGRRPRQLVRGPARPVGAGAGGPPAGTVCQRSPLRRLLVSQRRPRTGFRHTLNGHCASRQELAELPLPLQAKLAVLPCRGGEGFLDRTFRATGLYRNGHPHPLDETFPEWGAGPYFTVLLEATCRLSDLLTTYVLVPVLDDEKHYWVGDDEVEKLLRHGEGWLGRHPEREAIAHAT